MWNVSKVCNGKVHFEQRELVNRGFIMCTFTRHREAILPKLFFGRSADLKKKNKEKEKKDMTQRLLKQSLTGPW